DAPVGDGVGDAVDQLADRALAAGGAELAAEVLLDDDVGGRLAPGLGHLDVALLEDHLAALAADAGGAQLPLDAAVAIIAGAGEVALDLDAGSDLPGAPRGGCLAGCLGREGVR